MGFDTKQLGYLLIAIVIVFNLATSFTLAREKNTIQADPELERFFDSFDSNKNNRLEWNEASTFYNWVKRNIRYRYDDENQVSPLKGMLVGDGRIGDDYQQTPQETFNERAGDCEDQNGLQVAFFRYWGYESKLGVVKIKANDYHAVALVKVDDLSPLQKFGKIFTYDIDFMRGIYYGLTPGKYIVVDNTYGTRVGDLSSRISDTSLIMTLN